MCGIFGYSGAIDSSVLDRMRIKQEHRGPDSYGTWLNTDEKVGLGQNRLSIIDLSDAGKQPMLSEDGKTVLVFNGEIYNYQTLKDQLIAKGIEFRSNTDSEVLLHLYRDKGADMLKDIRGMFVFAIYDIDKDEVFIARDHYGIKPFYYAQYDNKFVFASEMKTLLEEKSIPKDLDYEAISDHLTFLWCPFPKTILKAVRKVEPGMAMIVKQGNIEKQWLYYDIPYEKDKRNISEEEAIKELDELLEASIKEQLMSDVPVGAFLSGGLDSSLIVAYMRKLNPKEKLKAYTISIGNEDMEGNPNDLPYAKQVADYFDIDLEEIEVNPKDVFQHIENLTYILDEPLADPAAINVQLITEIARKQGYIVLLSGAGGDDIFSGYRRHQAVLLDEKIYKIPGVFRKMLSLVDTSLKPTSAKKRKLKKFLYKIGSSRLDRMIGLFHWVREEKKQSLFSSDTMKKLKQYNSSKRMAKYLDRISNEDNFLNKCLYLDSKFFLTDHNLNYTDKMCMYNSIEGRVPYMDYRIVDWATKLPQDLKLQGGEAKYILKKVAEDYLPHDVIYRPKTGFGAPLREWVKEDLNPLYEKYFSKENIEKYNIFDYDQVWKLIEDNRKGKIDGAYTIFSILSIHIWLAKFLEN